MRLSAIFCIIIWFICQDQELVVGSAAFISNAGVSSTNLSVSKFWTAKSSFPNPTFQCRNYNKQRQPSAIVLRLSSQKQLRQEEDYNILSSRVIKDIPLPILIYYIQSYFKLPSNLPMPFEDYSNEENEHKETSIIRTWYCPLIETDKEHAKLFVEVIGLRIQNEDILPSMAMVAIKQKKKKKSTNSNQIKKANALLEGTQKLILRALDCGIDDLLTNPKTQEHVQYQLDTNTNNPEQTTQTSVLSTATTNSETDSSQVKTTDNDIISYYNSQQLKQNNLKGKNKDSSHNPSTPVDAIVDNTSNIPISSTNVIVDVDATNVPMQSKTMTQPTQRRHTDNQQDKQSEEEDIPQPNIHVFDENPFVNMTNMKQMLNENDEDDEDNTFTLEELAKQVMDFGQQEQEQVGMGFAKTAWKTAKEIVKERRSTTTSKHKLDYGFEEEGEEPSKDEEELRKIFAAGQKFAESKISVSSSTGTKNNRKRSTDEEEDDMERLINSDKTVPRATADNILEEELAELQVRIRLDPEEDEPIPPGGVFDLFQGPPQADDDNDPAMDWPGSSNQQRRRSTPKLPSSLVEAVNQANFAARTLLNMTKSPKDGKFYNIGNGKEVPLSRVKLLCKCVEEAVEIGIIENPMKLVEEMSRLELLLAELRQSSEDRFGEIVSGFKDLCISDNFVPLIRHRLNVMAEKEQQQKTNTERTNERDRENLGKLVQYAMVLLKETQSLGAELEAMQLEIIRSICEVAMDPRHTTEEEAAIALSDAVQNMRPLLDENFVAYLKFAIMEEEGRLKRRGLLDDPEHNSWLFVLQIIQGGVYAELSKTVQRHVDSIMYVLRMDTKARRRRLLELFVKDLPSLDVRPFRKVVDNIVGSLGTIVRGEDSSPEVASVLGGMTIPILQLASDIKEVLPPERMREKAKDGDDWIKSQRKKISQLQEERRQRLLAKKAEKESLSGVGNNLFEADPIETGF